MWYEFGRLFNVLLLLAILFQTMKTYPRPTPKSHQVLIAVLLLLVNFYDLTGQTLPAGFTSVQVVSGLLKPAAMTFAPDGRIFIAEQDGYVRVVKNGALLSTPMIKLRVNLRGEGGLIGIALDPNFSSNQYLYLYYTLHGGARNRISRFKVSGDIASPSTEQIILNLDTLIATIHNGGAMHFKEGKLYVATGENSNEANAQNLDTYHGKVIRINPDGSIPAGNPYTSGSDQKRRIWSYGLRNPFTFAIQPGTGKIFVNDVGFNAWEEINDATSPGKNYGWPAAEGNSSNPAYTNAVYAYEHGRNDEFGCAITGGTFFNPPQTNYPAAYAGRYFFQDYCGQWIKTLNLSVSPPAIETFATGVGNDALYLTTGNDGNLYYLIRSTGSLYKIVYSSNQAPVILNHPVSASVSMGQSASFSVTASGKTPFTYQWQKNGVNISGATNSSYTISQAAASDAGGYRVRVSNSAGSALSNTAQLTVTGFNNDPVAQIITPSAGALYRAGDVISFSGNATDQEDGELPAYSFTWYADFHHDTHHHDSPPVATGAKSGSFTIPVRGETSDNVWYRLILIVTDSQGAKDTMFRDIHPRKSTITLLTQPTGLKIKLDGASLSTPLSFVSVERLERNIGAVNPQTVNGKIYTFDKWLHGGNETQTISTPLEDVTYTAVYKETTGGNLIQREVWSGIAGTDVASIPVNTPPSFIDDLPDFESPVNSGSDYGARVRGYIHVPATGSYIFWIASDDKSELWLSSNDNPANKQKIASVTGHTKAWQWDKYTTQKSAPVNLTVGQKYYIEALHKESAGGDHLAVGWQLPGGALERPITGNRLSRYISGNTPPIVDISTPAAYQVFSAPVTISIAANASDPGGSITKVEFYQGNIKLGEDKTSPYSFSWNSVSAGNYTVVVKAFDNTGASATDEVNIIVKGMIQRELWTGITGTSVTAIPVDSPPDAVSNLFLMEGPTNQGSDYGSRLRGYIHPPSNGNYIFWIASDDKSELWLSTTTHPDDKVKIASVTGHTGARQWNKYVTQQSAPISLSGGKRYYIEVLHKEATGVDHLSVGWQLPDHTMERPIPGNRISPFSATDLAMATASVAQNYSGSNSLSLSDDEKMITLSPNPLLHGKITFTIFSNATFSDDDNVVVEIVDVTGHVLYTERIYCSEGCTLMTINSERHLPAGVYMVSINTNTSRSTKRLIVH